MVVFSGIDGYSKTNNRQADVQRLIDSNVIGLMVDDDIQYDAIERQKIRKDLEIAEKCLESNSLKIQNYIMVEPYPGGVSHRIFVHGKELFETPESANNFFSLEEKTASLFNPLIIERIAKTFLPDVFDQRVSKFPLGKAEVEEIDIKSLMTDYPHIDFTPFAQMEINKDNIVQFAALLQENGVNLAEELSNHNSTHGQASRNLLIKQKIKDKIPTQIANYLQDKSNFIEQKAKDRWGETLKSYAAQHQYDWEILNNFKSAANAYNGQYDSLEEMLYAGAIDRAKSILLAQSSQLKNPYQEPFNEIESSMARIIVDTVPPNILNWSIEKKLPTVFVDETNIDGIFEPGFQQGGKYHPSHGNHFDDIVYYSNSRLSHKHIAYLVNHEMAHALDYRKDFKQFANQFANVLPTMIKQDGLHLAGLIEWVRTVNIDSPPEQLNILSTLGRMRGLDGDTRKDFKTLKKTVLNALEDIKDWSLSTFDDGTQNTYYATRIAQHIEVPAVISHLKGQYQDNLISLALPNLSTAVKIDQAIKLDSHKDGTKTAKLEKVVEQLKKSIAQFSTNQETIDTQKISALLKKKSGLQI